MKTFRFIPLFALSLIASPLYAASVTLTAEEARPGDSFSIPVTVDVGAEKVNVVEGLVAIPEGIIVDSVSTAGSALVLWPRQPAYVVADKAVEFTGGVPGSLPSHALLFTIRAHAEHPGTYTFSPSEFAAYRNDGKGTRVTLAETAIAVNIAEDAKPTGGAASEPVAKTSLIADLGRDASLFDGKYFVSFYGGDNGRGVDHYVVQEGWWGRAVVADRYYVLKDQGQGSSVHITAVNTDGSVQSTTLPAAHPWTERLTLLVAFVVLAAFLAGMVRFIRKP